MMIAAIEETLLKASTFIGRITQISFAHYQSTHSGGNTGGSQTHLREALSRSLSHLWGSLEAVSVIMQHTAQCHTLHSAASKSDTSSAPMSVFTAAQALGKGKQMKYIHLRLFSFSYEGVCSSTSDSNSLSFSTYLLPPNWHNS